MLDFTPCRRKWTWRTGNSSSNSRSNWKDISCWMTAEKDGSGHTWYNRSCKAGISGRKWPRRSYDCISLTRRQKASSSGIYASNVMKIPDAGRWSLHWVGESRPQMVDLDSSRLMHRICRSSSEQRSRGETSDLQRIGLQDVKQVLLTDALSVVEECMMRERSETRQ